MYFAYRYTEYEMEQNWKKIAFTQNKTSLRIITL